MSYTLSPYIVDLEKLRAAVGGGDEALLAAVIAGSPEEFEPDEDEDEDEEGIPVREALRHLVMGEAPDPDPASAHRYGYALEHLCGHLGEWLGSDAWSGITWPCLEATGMDELLEQSGAPVPLPERPDFPVIGHVTPEAVAAIVERLGEGRLTTAAPGGRKRRKGLGGVVRSALVGAVRSSLTGRRAPSEEDVRELLEEYESWLREAGLRGQALVFFYS